MTNKLHCAEFVFPGHPDKLSDAIADALVQEAEGLGREGFVSSIQGAVRVPTHSANFWFEGNTTLE